MLTHLKSPAPAARGLLLLTIPVTACAWSMAPALGQLPRTHADSGTESHARWHQAPTAHLEEDEVPTLIPPNAASDSWFAPWSHSHTSKSGTPFVHLFGLEPAFLDRDLFMDYRTINGLDEDETEVEVELEWALTNRLGVVFELPYVRLDPDGGDSSAGVGDWTIAPRALLIAADDYLLSANLGITFPTGNEGEGLGSGEVSVSPSLSAWFDLGQWVQLSAQAGIERGRDSGDREAFYNGALVYLFQAPGQLGEHDHLHGDGRREHPRGLTSAILELSARTGLNGPNDGRSRAELLFGISHNLAGAWDLRAGYQVALGGDRDLENAAVLSLVRHF